MKNTISNSIVSKTQRIGLGFMILAAFGFSTAYAQGSQTEETVKVLRVKKNAPKHETRTVKGRVTDSATGTPMGGVRVQALGMNRYSTLTNEDGTYEVEIPVFINTVYVYAPEYNPLQVAISEKAKSKGAQRYKDILEVTEGRTVPSWLEADHENFTGKVVEIPSRDVIDVPVNPTLIVELYSK